MSRPNFLLASLRPLDIEGQRLWVRRLSAAESRQVGEAIKENNFHGAALGISRGACLEDGSPLFSSPEQALEELPTNYLQPILNAIMAHTTGEILPAK